MEHTKTKLFNFTKGPRDTRSTSLSIDLGFNPFTGSSPLQPKKIWRYLGVFFDRMLSFTAHVKFYATKSISTVRCMRILGNSNRGLTPKQKRTLYMSCVLPVATYGLRCWYQPGTWGFISNIKMLNLTHSQGARWITGAFRTSPTGGVLAAARLMLMHFNLKKLYDRSTLWNETLHYNHPSLSLLDQRNSKGSILHPDALSYLSRRKRDIVKSPLDGELLQTLSETFMPLHKSIKPGI
jgi:hypothetical protein